MDELIAAIVASLIPDNVRGWRWWRAVLIASLVTGLIIAIIKAFS